MENLEICLEKETQSLLNDLNEAIKKQKFLKSVGIKILSSRIDVDDLYNLLTDDKRFAELSFKLKNKCFL